MTMLERQYLELLSGQRTGPLAATCRGLLWLLSLGYSALIRLRNIWYSTIPGVTHQADCPVISVGNITVGGTGKTPMTIKLARMCSEKGRQAGIILRGYKGGELDDTAGGHKQARTSDEAMLLKRHCPEAKIFIEADRVAAAREATKFGCNAIVLDDGFQHRRLKRALDIVLIDSTQPFGHGYVLPRGLLREPLGSLRRAHLIVLTRSDCIDISARALIVRSIRKYAGDIPVLMSEHRIIGFGDLEGRPVTVEDPKVMQAVIFAGIANFESFRHSVEQLGIHVVAAYQYPDHHAYSSEEIDGLVQTAANVEANVLLTTEKDAVKLSGRWPIQGCRVLVLRLEMQLTGDSEQVLAQALDTALK